MKRINYLTKKAIKDWLLQNYTYTDQQTFISPTQLLGDYSFSIYEKDEDAFEYSDIVGKEDYIKFWKHLQKILKELKWPIEEGYITYQDEDQTKIPGIFYLLKLKDKDKKLNTIPKSRIIDEDERSAHYAGVDNISYFMDFLGAIEDAYYLDNIDPFNDVYPDLGEPYIYWNKVDLIKKQ